MSGLRIAMIGQRGLPATYGGIEHHVEHLGAELVRRGHEVTVYCRTNYVDDRQPEHLGMRLRHLPTLGTKHFDAIVHSMLSTVAALAARYDVVHYHALGPGMLSVLPRALSGASVVQTVHGLDDERVKWGSLARRILHGAGWMSAHVPDATLVVSRALAEHYAGKWGRDATYIPNGAPEAELRPPGSALARLGVEAGRYVLFVGRLVPEKAPDLLLRAFRDVPGDVSLVLAGGSSYTNDYVERLHRLAGEDRRVVMAGYVYGEELQELYSNAACFVLPSELEGMPLTLLEACSFGRPVVASDIPPHLEVLQGDGPGRTIVPTGDGVALAAAIAGVLVDPAGAEAAAVALQASVTARYRWAAIAAQTEELYLQLRSRDRVIDLDAPAPAPPAARSGAYAATGGAAARAVGGAAAGGAGTPSTPVVGGASPREATDPSGAADVDPRP